MSVRSCIACTLEITNESDSNVRRSMIRSSDMHRTRIPGAIVLGVLFAVVSEVMTGQVL